MIFRFLRFMFRLAVRGYFRDISYEGLERIPERGPVLLLPNHPNGLIDPFLVMIALKRSLSLTAKSTLAKNPLLALLFKLGNVVPLQRRQDLGEGADLKKNSEAFLEVRKRLSAGDAICLFPEGISHNEPELQPLKTGAARIALEYLELDGDRGGLKLIPVGIDYVRKERFRSSALVRVAEPIELALWRRENPSGDARALMAAVAERIRQNTLNFEARQESLILSFAAELSLTRAAEPRTIAETESSARPLIAETERLQAAYLKIKEEHSETLTALGTRIGALRARLKAVGISAAELYLDLSPLKALRFCFRESLMLCLLLPLAFLALLCFLPVYLGCLALTEALTRDRDVRATYAIFSALLFFPLAYLGWLAAGAYWLGPAWAFVAALALPLSIVAALRLRDHGFAVLRRSFAFMRLAVDPELRRELRTEADKLLVDIQGLQARAAAS